MNLHELLEELRYETLSRRGYTRGLVAMARAIEKGESVGALTARGNQRGHLPLIKRIERFAGGKVRYKYFVNDVDKSKRLYYVKDTAARKLAILIEFRNGFSGKRKFDKVKFYDDEQKNIDYVDNIETHFAKFEKEFRKANNLSSETEIHLDNIKAYNIKLFDYKKLDDLAEKNRGGNVIHFFDLDGTVIKTSAKMYTMVDGKSVRDISQEELATQMDKISKELNERYGAGNWTIDFSDFGDPKKIKKQIRSKSFKEESHGKRIKTA